MKYVCNKKCAISIDGGVKARYNPGQVVEAKECPSHFAELPGQVDFLASPEDVLTNTKWAFEDAHGAVLEAYDVSVTRGTKAEVVAQILDARERAVADTGLPPKAE